MIGLKDTQKKCPIKVIETTMRTQTQELSFCVCLCACPHILYAFPLNLHCRQTLYQLSHVGRPDTCKCKAESLCCTPETNVLWEIYYIPLKKIHQGRSKGRKSRWTYISLHGYIRNKLSDTEVIAEHLQRVGRST